MRMSLRNRGTFIYLILFGVISTSFAQSRWEELLKKENGCVIEQNQLVEITVTNEGILEIVADIYEETQHFGDITNFYSEQSIGYSNTFTEISNLNAYSLIPNGKNKYKKIEVTDFVTSDSRSSGVFYDDQKKISYVFPALSTDSKSVISYTKKYKEPRLWGYFMFSSFFPVEKSKFSVKVPQNVKLDFSSYSISEDQIEYHKESKGKYVIYTWSAEKLDKIRLSKGTNGVLHTAPHLIIHVDSYEYKGVRHTILGDVHDLHAWYQNFLVGIEDEESAEMKLMVNNIIEGKATELEKVEAIYNWVQQNIKYIAIEDGLGGFKPRASNVVFSRRYGDCKDMSNLLHNMLGMANIPSNLTWIGTMAIPYSHREVPTPMADNHMICTYETNEQYYFLDATDQYNRLGIPTSHIQGREALINKGANEFELVDVPVVSSEKNLTMDSLYFVINEGVILGSGRTMYSGYKKSPIANNLENLDEDDKKSFLNLILKKGNNKFFLNSVTTCNVIDKNKDLLIDYDFTIEDYAISSDDEIFVNPHFSKLLDGEFIDIGLTKEPIHFDYKSETLNVYGIEIPQGYEVSFLPENVQSEQDEYGFSIEYAVIDNQILINQKIKINTLQLKTNQFESWNKMVKEVFTASKESIVLAKK